MNYTFEIKKWYIIDKKSHGFLEKGQFLGTIKNVEFFDTETEYFNKLNELGVEPENIEE